MTLREKQRLKTQADKETFRQLKEDILNERIPTSVNTKRHFKFATEVKTTSNIADENTTREGVGHSVRKLLNKTEDYAEARYWFAAST